MHVCLLAHIFPAPSETFIRELAVGLRRRDHRVTVVARRPNPTVSATELLALDQTGVERVYIGDFASPKLNRLRALWLRWRMSKLRTSLPGDGPQAIRQWLVAASECLAIERLTPDVVHVHFGDHASRLLTVAPPEMLSRCLVTWHGYDANAVPMRDGPNVFQQLFSTPIRHTVGSEFMRKRLHSLGAAPQLVECVPMGVDVERFKPAGGLKDSRGKLRVLSVGRLQEVKGHRHLIAAVGILHRRGTPLELRIAGGGHLRQELERQIQSERLDNVVTLLGAVPSSQVLEEMKHAHLFALTGVPEASGKVEAQGLVYAEAQAVGLPVVGSRVGGVPEALLHDQTGLLCEPGDEACIAEAIQRFASDRVELERFGVRARAFAEERFSLGTMLDRFEALYAAL